MRNNFKQICCIAVAAIAITIVLAQNQAATRKHRSIPSKGLEAEWRSHPDEETAAKLIERNMLTGLTRPELEEIAGHAAVSIDPLRKLDGSEGSEQDRITTGQQVQPR